MREMQLYNKNYWIQVGKISDLLVLIISAKHFSEDITAAHNANNFTFIYDRYTAEMLFWESPNQVG